LLGIGWLIDLFLIPAMDREADLRFNAGYHRLQRRVDSADLFGCLRRAPDVSGQMDHRIIYLFTGGLFFLGVLYDFWTLNDQISMKNAQR
jgi:hypothetical protein